MPAEPLTLAVREHAAWCDLVCRLHGFAPQGDARLWWTPRRAPDGLPDAATLEADQPVLDVIGRIHDGPGASVVDSFGDLDLSDQGWVVEAEPTWVARPPGAGDAADPPTFAAVKEKLVFAAWCHAAGDARGAIPAGLRRASGVTVLGRGDHTGFTDGVVVHRTVIGGTAVAGVWDRLGDVAATTAAAAQRHPDAWLIGRPADTTLDAFLAAGFAAVGPLRVWRRTLG